MSTPRTSAPTSAHAGRRPDGHVPNADEMPIGPVHDNSRGDLLAGRRRDCRGPDDRVLLANREAVGAMKRVARFDGTSLWAQLALVTPVLVLLLLAVLDMTSMAGASPAL